MRELTLIAIVCVSILSHSLLHFLLCCSLTHTLHLFSLSLHHNSLSSFLVSFISFHFFLPLPLSPIATHTQPNRKPLHIAAGCGHNLCVALLLLADDSILRVMTKDGDTPVDSACKRNENDTAAAMEKWASGDKAGALRDLGAAHLIS